MLEKEKRTFGEVLKEALNIEKFSSTCYGHLPGLIKNGRIKKKFVSFSLQANRNVELLREILKKAGIEFNLLEGCSVCKLNPESFSLIGVLGLAWEINKRLIECYKGLIRLADTSEKKIFKDILKEKMAQKNFLKKERNFAIDKEEASRLACLRKLSS